MRLALVCPGTAKFAGRCLGVTLAITEMICPTISDGHTSFVVDIICGPLTLFDRAGFRGVACGVKHVRF